MQRQTACLLLAMRTLRLAEKQRPQDGRVGASAAGMTAGRAAALTARPRDSCRRKTAELPERRCQTQGPRAKGQNSDRAAAGAALSLCLCARLELCVPPVLRHGAAAQLLRLPGHPEGGEGRCRATGWANAMAGGAARSRMALANNPPPPPPHAWSASRRMTAGTQTQSLDQLTSSPPLPSPSPPTSHPPTHYPTRTWVCTTPHTPTHKETHTLTHTHHHHHHIHTHQLPPGLACTGAPPAQKWPARRQSTPKTGRSLWSGSAPRVCRWERRCCRLRAEQGGHAEPLVGSRVRHFLLKCVCVRGGGGGEGGGGGGARARGRLPVVVQRGSSTAVRPAHQTQ